MSEAASEKPPGRLISLDAYRGFTMLAMASAGFAFAQVGRNLPESTVWSVLEHQTDHCEWRGCTSWDLIQPSFMFIVGVAMPFSFANRRASGQSWSRQFGHAIWRSAILVALGVFLASAWSKQTNYTFTNVLAQIGLGYTFVFLVLGRRPLVQFLVAMAILAGYWLLFAVYPLPGPDFDYRGAGVSTTWVPMPGFAGHWEKHTNVAAAFDRWFLNLFPQPPGQPFRFNEGGYTTLNFIPSIATMIAGVLAGELLRSRRSSGSKLQALLIVGAVCLVLGTALDQTICPVVKRIWTPSWVIYSTGWTCWLLLIFYGLIDVAGLRRWSFPFVVVGANSIAMYMMAQLMKPFVGDSIRTHFGLAWRTFATWEPVDAFVSRTYYTHLNPRLFEGLYGPIVRSAAVLLVLWLICLWMYRRKIFIKI